MFADGSFSALAQLVPGANSIPVRAVDAAGNAASLDVAVRSNTVPPSVRIAAPADGAVTNASSVAVRVLATPADAPDAVMVAVNGVAAARQADGSFSATVPIGAGTTALHADATDGYGLTSSAQVSVVQDLVPPQISVAGARDGEITDAPSVRLTFLATDDHP